MGGSVVYKSDHGILRVGDLGNIYGETKTRMSLDDLIEKLKGILVYMTVWPLKYDIKLKVVGLYGYRIEDSDNSTAVSN